MIYQNLTFPKIANRAFFYTNFVATVDGKVGVKRPGYWPIGSKIDHDVLIELRAYADVLIHGRNVAKGFPTIHSLEKPEFQELRKSLGKSDPIWYMVISNHPGDELTTAFNPEFSSKQFVVTSEDAIVSDELQKKATILRFGKEAVDLDLLAKYLYDQKKQHVLLEGGPTLLGSFFKDDLVDEIYLTIAPKIFGNQKDATITMVEGYLFPPDKVKEWKLISIKQIDNEVFLRYNLNK